MSIRQKNTQRRHGNALRPSVAGTSWNEYQISDDSYVIMTHLRVVSPCSRTRGWVDWVPARWRPPLGSCRRRTVGGPTLGSWSRCSMSPASSRPATRPPRPPFNGHGNHLINQPSASRRFCWQNPPDSVPVWQSPCGSSNSSQIPFRFECEYSTAGGTHLIHSYSMLMRGKWIRGTDRPRRCKVNRQVIGNWIGIADRLHGSWVISSFCDSLN